MKKKNQVYFILMLNANSVPSDHDYKYVIFCYYKGYTKDIFTILPKEKS